jgi:hypothetical protein
VSIFLRVLAFVALTAPLTWLWVTGVQDAYTRFFSAVAGPLLASVGVADVAESPARERFISYVPFLVLMAITPKLSLRRRALGLLLGLPLIFLCHVGLVIAESFAHSGGRPTEDPFSTVFPAAMFADAFPFILWALIANRVLRDVLGRALGGTGAGAPS